MLLTPLEEGGNGQSVLRGNRPASRRRAPSHPARRRPSDYHLYLLKHLRRRLSFNSLQKVTRILGFLHTWSLRQTFSLRERLESGIGLTQSEIEGSLCSWLRRNFRTADEVRSLVVAPSSIKFRLDAVWHFVSWHFDAAISVRPVGSSEIKDIRTKQTACKKIFADAAKGRGQSSEHAKPLLAQGQVCRKTHARIGPGFLKRINQALCVVYTNQMHRGSKTALLYAAQPIADQQIRDFLTARTGIKNIFERSGIVDADGQPIDISSKGFRHFLNNLLDEGGAPDLVQTKWFGRKNPADTRAYQHLTPAQRAKKVADEIFAGKLVGEIADIVKVLPTDVGRAFLTARIQAVHDVGPGMCVHDFQMMPCPRHLQCDADCGEYLWEKADKERKDALVRQVAMVQLSIRAARSRKATGGIVKSDWWRHLKARYRQLLMQMKSSGLGKSDIARFIAENGLDSSGEFFPPSTKGGS